MQSTTVKIITLDTPLEDQFSRDLLPSFKEAITKASLKSHDAEMDLLSESLIQVISSLGQVVDKIASQPKESRPKKISFSLGLDSNGSVGVLSTVAASISHTASITVEFELEASD